MAIKLRSQLKATVLRTLVDVRLNDAKALLKTGVSERRNGAVYLGGYAVECALKARLCFDRDEMCLDPNLYTHCLRSLAEKTAVWRKLLDDSSKMELFVYLETEWDVGLRYTVRPLKAPEVLKYLDRAKEFSEWLFEN